MSSGQNFQGADARATERERESFKKKKKPIVTVVFPLHEKKSWRLCGVDSFPFNISVDG